MKTQMKTLYAVFELITGESRLIKKFDSMTEAVLFALWLEDFTHHDCLVHAC